MAEGGTLLLVERVMPADDEPPCEVALYDVMMLVLIPGLAVFAQPYGWLLLLKIAGFALLMALASANRWRLGPAVARGATLAFKRSLAAEYGLIVAVLAATATMTSLYSP
jgi:putative copper export protein